MSFQDMKRKSQANIESMVKELEKLNKNSDSYKDDRFWQVTKDKTGNGYAIIRFLPPAEGEDVPWVRIWSHGFKGSDGSWYIENCPTTLNGQCPVCQANSKLWNSGLESDKIIARDRKRKLRYVSNIYVVSDPANPENNGKVFLFSYGQKIFDKIQQIIKPENPAKKPANPLDFWTGRDFELTVKTVQSYPNYDSSVFGDVSALLNGDDVKLQELWSKQYKLSELVTPDKFKPFAELQEKFNKVANSSGVYPDPSARVSSAAPSPAAKSVSSVNVSKPPFEANKRTTPATTDSDDPMDYFKQLSQEDE